MKKRFVVRFALSTLVLLIVLLSGWTILAKRSSNQLPPFVPNILPSQAYKQIGPLVSRNVPAFASSSAYSTSNANADHYDTSWRSRGTPIWLAYDLSRVPAAQRSKLLVVWYNGTGNYDHTIINYAAYNMPQDYTIDANVAAGGDQPSATGWVTLATVRGNHYHSRQHVVDMTSYNWIRINITAIDGSAQNEDASINMDVYDANAALQDDWIFFGDSITAGAMGHQTLNGVASFAQLINTAFPNYYPAQESGGIGYLSSIDGVKYLNTWLGLFPGKYVGLDYGTNDALGCVNSTKFYNNYVTMVQDVLQAGKTPVVPHIPWGRSAKLQRCVPNLNAKIDALYAAFPQIIHGPDLWTFFQSHQDLISSDNVHPTQEGFGAYRQQWANAMLAEVYAHT
ncbi:MAG: SGNH/GDSL hydrolase family protein [Ktedonobacteraceae bacterium]